MIKCTPRKLRLNILRARVHVLPFFPVIVFFLAQNNLLLQLLHLLVELSDSDDDDLHLEVFNLLAKSVEDIPVPSEFLSTETSAPEATATATPERTN